MSILLDARTFPLSGSRLIEASAGTGKTWTIAALYLRLVLGHGGDHGFARPLLPSEILVMTFTRAATRELSNRVRERLVQAAAFFRGEAASSDPYLQALSDSYTDPQLRSASAHRLQLAAETMDEAAIFTIDAWCQRMLREHAFDSGSLFDEELVSDERALFEDAAHDYWRQQVYPLNRAALGVLQECWSDVAALKTTVRPLLRHVALFDVDAKESLAGVIARVQRSQLAALARLKTGWPERVDAMEQWIAGQRGAHPKCFNGTKLRPDSLVKWFAMIRAWAANPAQHTLDLEKGWYRLSPEGLADTFAKGFDVAIPACFDDTIALQTALDAIEPLSHALLRHATVQIDARIAQLKAGMHQFGFADMLERLKTALEGANGPALRERIRAQYPIAMVDEFQDTSPDQYRIFNLLYDVGANDPATGLFLIGDPKQSIYGFRGADINSYLAARTATEGRHYQLGTNYRSTTALVDAVNQLFLHAEEGYAHAAFRFRKGDVNPLPFTAVEAQGKSTHLVGVDGPYQALAVAATARDDLKADDYRSFFAHHCAEHIVGLLNSEQVGFTDGVTFTRLVPADIAILVRDRREAAAIRSALAQRKVPSVYLSDQDSVVDSDEAQDVLRWLHAVANPLDGALARAAFATRTAGLPLAELARLSSDETVWEAIVEQLKALHASWQRQGVLAMLRRLIHELKLPARLLAEPGGERRLTNLLHLAELLQTASRELDGEQALIRWFAEQLAGLGEGGEGNENRVLRLESDAELVKVITVHKSKGLEYPLVYLPFAVSARKTDKRGRSFFDYVDADGERQIDLGRSDAARDAVDAARIEEDLRLLYVALTRAAHFLWLGVAAIASTKKGENRLHDSALGYLLAGGAPVPAADLRAHWERLQDGLDAIVLHDLPPADGCTMLARVEARASLRDAAHFDGSFERDWSVGSFTSIARHASAPPMRAQEETTREEDSGPVAGRSANTEDAPWHRFPRGSVPGNFLHEQLEWLAGEGFNCIDHPATQTRLEQRIARAGWGHRQQDALAWLQKIATTPLLPLNAPLAAITALLPEMEFWFPTERLDVGALDRLCTAHLLDGVNRPQLPPRALHGMLKGFADLVFEHEGKYWVLDYKSNALGAGDAAYTRAAMGAGMAVHRYDIQGAIYLLALHRLLRSRLGENYDPTEQLGGAVFFFLRGVANPVTHGCYTIATDLALLDGLDALLDEGAA